MEYHKSVLLKNVIELLDIRKEGIYVDATLGGGGHFIEIAKRLDDLGGGVVVGLDVDDDSLAYVKELLEKERFNNTKTILIKGNFKDISSLLIENNIKSINGVLYDFGVSSYQIDTPAKGFSYMKEGPLDMRMDQSLSLRAEDLINGLYEKELENLFSSLGEERYAKRIAKAIVENRKKYPIKTTTKLVEVIRKSVPMINQIGSHPAKRVFQALRIAVNSELESIAISLPRAFEILALEGVICTISFHSLEDKIVKEFVKTKVKEGFIEDLLDGVMKPGEEEVGENSRAKSAKLRSFKKIR